MSGNPSEQPKTPSLPKLSVEEILALATTDTERFKEIATAAGHKDADTFLQILSKAKERQGEEASRARPPADPYSRERFMVPPDPTKVEYYAGLRRDLDSKLSALRTTSDPVARKRAVARIQDIFKQIYDRERHEMVYDRVTAGKPLDRAIEEVAALFRERAERSSYSSNIPYDAREAEKKALDGVSATSYYEVDMGTDILGPSWKFGELGLQNKRGGLAGGRRYWPRGNPDNSLDE